jgi:hypothetical protein
MKARTISVLVLFAVGILLAACGTEPETIGPTGSGGYEGIALDRNASTAIADVWIVFEREDGAVRKEVTTGSNGGYRIELPQGRYRVTASHDGCQTYTTGSGFFVVTGSNFQTGNIFLVCGAESRLPDLVLTNIILKPKPAGYGYENEVIVNTVVRNNGADCEQGFAVWCWFTCAKPQSNSQTYFGMDVTNGLGRNQEVTVGDDALLDLSDCSFQSQREFTCEVDSPFNAGNVVAESDESNNTRTETLLTGR